MSDIIRNVMFKQKSKKDATWKNKDIFKVKSNTITYNQVQHYAMTYYLIR